MAGLKNGGSENTWWSQTHGVLKGNRAELMGQLSKANTGETTPNHKLISTKHTQHPACLLRNKFCLVDFLEEKKIAHAYLFITCT